MKLRVLLFSCIFSLVNNNYIFRTKNSFSSNGFVPVNKVSFNFCGTKETKDLGVIFRFFMTPDIYNYFNLLVWREFQPKKPDKFIESLIEDKKKIEIAEVREKWGEVIDNFNEKIVPAFHSKYPSAAPINHSLQLEFYDDLWWNIFSYFFRGFTKSSYLFQPEARHLEEVLRHQGAMLCIFMRPFKNQGWRVFLKNSTILPQENAGYLSSIPDDSVQKYEPLSFYYLNLFKIESPQSPEVIIPYNKTVWNVGGNIKKIYRSISRHLGIPTGWMRDMNITGDYLVYVDPKDFAQNIKPGQSVVVRLCFCTSRYYHFELLIKYHLMIIMDKK